MFFNFKQSARALLVFGALSASSGVYATPSIHVGEWYDFMNPTRTTLVKSISNDGSSTAFVRVSAVEVFARDDYQTKTEAVDKKAATLQALDGLIVTPSRLIIPTGTKQNVRAFFKGSRDVERYFRVSFIPVAPDKSALDEFGVDEKATKDLQEKQVGVTIMAGYGTLFTVMPSNPRYNTKITQDKKGVNIKNEGNASVMIIGAELCNKENECKYEGNTHVRPGKTLTYDLSNIKLMKFKVKEGEQETQKTFSN